MPANFTSNNIFTLNNSTFTHVAGDQVNINFSVQSIHATGFPAPRRQHHRPARGPTGNNAKHAAVDQSHVHKSVVSIRSQQSEQNFEASQPQHQNSGVSDPPSHNLLPLLRNNLSEPAGTANTHLQSHPTLTVGAQYARGNQVQINASQPVSIPEMIQGQRHPGDGRGENIRPCIVPSSASPSRAFPTGSHHSQLDFYNHYEQSSNRVISMQQASSTQAHVNIPRNVSVTDRSHMVTPDYHHTNEAASGFQHFQAIAQMFSTKRACANT